MMNTSNKGLSVLNDDLAIEAKKSNEKMIQLIDNNEGLIHYIIKKRMRGNVDYEDMVQNGRLGILRAVQTYDSKKGSFITYAYHWITAMVEQAIFDSEQIAFGYKFYRDMQEYKKIISSPEMNHISFNTKEFDEKLREKNIDVAYKDLLKYYSEGMVSLDSFEQPIQTTSPFSEIEDEVFKRVCADKVREALKTLTKNERSIIVTYYGLNNVERKNMCEIARSRNVSKQAINNAHKNATCKLRKNEDLIELNKYI